MEKIPDTTAPVMHDNSVEYPLFLRVTAQFFSYLFHPLFIPVMATAYLAFTHQGYFIGITPQRKMQMLITVMYSSVFLPAFTILLLKGVGFINSIFLRTQRERIIPYVATNIFYFWIFLVFQNQPDVPPVLTAFILGIFLSSSIALIANIYFKISMHALGMGAFSGVLLVIILSGFPYNIFLPAVVLFIITGIVCTSRMIVSNHTPFDIFAGLFFSIVCQFAAAVFIR